MGRAIKCFKSHIIMIFLQLSGCGGVVSSLHEIEQDSLYDLTSSKTSSLELITVNGTTLQVTKIDGMFVRNNGIPPIDANPDNWTLEVGGESCVTPTKFSIKDLRERFEEITLQLQLECGGNGRSEFVPAASGNQWTTGAIGCPEFTGVRLRDVLNYCGITTDAEYVGYYGADTHTSGNTELDPISRGVPIGKAMERESIIAWAMNGEEIPKQNGFPLRLVCSGWHGSVSG